MIVNKRHLFKGLTLLIALGTIPIPGQCDALSELPIQWREKLQPVAEADLSGAEANSKKAITEGRQELAHQLLEDPSDERKLGDTFGKLGSLYHVYKIEAAAQRCYANALRLNPDSFRWVYFAGFLADEMGQPEDALALYRRAGRLKPGYSPLSLRRGESWLELNRLELAQEALENAAEKPGLRASALYYLAQIDLLKRRYREAIIKLEEVLELDPGADRAHYPLARALRAIGEHDRARDHLSKRGQRYPAVDDPMINELHALNLGARQFHANGMKAIKKQDFPAAVKAFKQGLTIDPDNLNARISFARALFLAGEESQAEEQLRAVLTRSPTHPLANFLTGVLLEHKGQVQQATEQYRKTLQIDPQHFGARFNLANQLFKSGNFREAASHYTSAMTANPDIPPARLFELIALNRIDTPDSAIRSRLEATLETYPEQHVLKYALVRLLVMSIDEQTQDNARALVLATELFNALPIPPHIGLLALASAANGDFEQAVILQNQVLSAVMWMGPEQRQHTMEVLTAYQHEELPAFAWHEDDTVLAPPPIDAFMMIREYPTAVPY